MNEKSISLLSVAFPVCGGHIFLIENKGNTQYPYHFFLSEKIFSYTEKAASADIKKQSNNNNSISKTKISNNGQFLNSSTFSLLRNLGCLKYNTELSCV